MEYKEGDVIWLNVRFMRLKSFEIHDKNVFVVKEIHFNNKSNESLIVYEEKRVGVIVKAEKDCYGFKGRIYTVRFSSYLFNSKSAVRKIGTKMISKDMKRIKIVGKLTDKEKRKHKKIIKALQQT